jgi:glucosyl-dolichyl phosphate glucuronosyltransferase
MPECPRTTAGCGTLLVAPERRQGAEPYWWPQNDDRVRNLIGVNMWVSAEVLRRAGGFASKLGRREAGGAIIGSVAESCEETEFCIGAARLHPGGMWIHCEKARVLHVGTRQRTTWRYFVRRYRMKGTAKAVLTGLTGTRDGLGSERRYTRTWSSRSWAILSQGTLLAWRRFLPVSQ